MSLVINSMFYYIFFLEFFREKKWMTVIESNQCYKKTKVSSKQVTYPEYLEKIMCVKKMWGYPIVKRCIRNRKQRKQKFLIKRNSPFFLKKKSQYGSTLKKKIVNSETKQNGKVRKKNIPFVNMTFLFKSNETCFLYAS